MSLAPRVSNASRNVFLFYSFSAVTFATQSPRKRTFSCGCALTKYTPPQNNTATVGCARP